MPLKTDMPVCRAAVADADTRRGAGGLRVLRRVYATARPPRDIARRAGPSAAAVLCCSG